MDPQIIAAVEVGEEAAADDRVVDQVAVEEVEDEGEEGAVVVLGEDLIKRRMTLVKIMVIRKLRIQRTALEIEATSHPCRTNLPPRFRQHHITGILREEEGKRGERVETIMEGAQVVEEEAVEAEAKGVVEVQIVTRRRKTEATEIEVGQPVQCRTEMKSQTMIM